MIIVKVSNVGFGARVSDGMAVQQNPLLDTINRKNRLGPSENI